MTRTIRNRFAIALLSGSVVLAAMPLAQALAEPAPPSPPAPPASPDAPRMEKRITIIKHGGDEPGADADRHTRVIIRSGGEDADRAVQECGTNPIADVDSAGEADGRHTRMRIRICANDGETPAQALDAVRRARTDVAGNRDIPDAFRADILGQLDSEIARLEKDAG